LAVITSSGAFVTLVLAVAALVAGADDFVLSEGAQNWLLAALIAFVISAVLGVFTNAPLEYDEPAGALHAWVDQNWSATASGALKAATLSDIETLVAAREKNGAKARLLEWAVSCEVAGLAFVAVASGLVLIG